MKNVLKKILPLSIKNILRDRLARRSLSHQPARRFDSSKLAHNDNFALDDMLSGSSAHWDLDRQKISDILGHQDKHGGVNPGDRRAIYTLIKELKPKSVLEIGTHIGASTLYIASALSHDAALITVDICDVNAKDAPWQALGLAGSPMQNLMQLGLEGQVDFICSSSEEFLRNTDKTFDFIFLDGDHGADTVYHEISLALRVLSEGGVILLHDYYPHGRALFPDNNIIPGPFRALERISAENSAIVVRPLGRLAWPTKQGSYNTSLALIMRGV